MNRPSLVSVRALVVASLSVVLAFGSLVVWRSTRALRSATEDVRAEHELRFVVRPLPAAANLGFETVSAPAVFLQAASFQDHL